MNLRLISFNAHNINDGTNYYSYIDGSGPAQAGARIIVVNRSGRRPVHAAKVLEKGTMTIRIEMRGTKSTQFDELKTWFDVEDETPRKLIAKDISNSDKQWYVYATVQAMPELRGDVVKVELSVADPVWYSETLNEDEWAITASGQTNEITVAGNLPARPILSITPTDAATSRWLYRRLAIWRNPLTVAQPNYPLNVIGTVLDTATLVTGSKMQADGDDIRVHVDGVEVPYWLQDINTANTKIWISIDFQPGIEFTLGTAIGATGAITTITLANTKANKSALSKAPAFGTVLFESELFTYTGINIQARQFTGVTRATKGTSEAAHIVGTAGYWIEHEIYLFYGNSGAAAPEADDTFKPIIDLTSTNTSWVYTSFSDLTGLRPGSWRGSIVISANRIDPDNKSNYYTGNQLAEADPATEMGMTIKAWKSGARWKGENATIEWNLFNPATFTAITVTGEKYRALTNWPNARFMASKDGKTWLTIFTDSTPSAAAAWEALAAHSAVAIAAGNKFIKFSFSGTIGATAGNYSAYEIEALTLTVESTAIPQGSLGSEESMYYLDAVITNTTSGEWIRIRTSCNIDDEIIIDATTKEAYLTKDNSKVGLLEKSTVRKDWLNLAVGANTISFVDVGTAGVDFVTNWRDRNS